MIKINPYYRTDEDLNKAEEPFLSITRILERLYLDGVNGKKDVSYSFKNTYAISCMRDIAEDLAKKQTTFVSRLNSLWGSLMHPNKQFSNSFDSYGVPYERYQGLIFGGVYYVLAKQKSVSVEHLDLLSSFVSAKAEALPYFNVYKEAAKPNASAIQSQDMDTLRKQFIRGINTNPDIVGKVDWADVTIAFSRSVMTEIFWGVENDDVLKAVCKNIINTWNKLYEKKDPRCYDEGVTGKGFVPNLDPWKFGGLTKEPIGVFFSKLWVERNAKTAYRSFGGDTNSDPDKPKSDSTVSDEEAMAKIRELYEKLQAKNNEYDAMKADNEQLLKEIEGFKLIEKDLKQQVLSLTKELETEKGKKNSEPLEEEQEVEMLKELESAPILQLLWYLMKLDGANVEGHGKKKPAQNIMSTLTKIPFDTTKKFWKKEDDPFTRQEELIMKMNHWMKVIGMNFQF